MQLSLRSVQDAHEHVEKKYEPYAFQLEVTAVETQCDAR